MTVTLTVEPFDPAAELSRFDAGGAHSDDGATVSFTGHARGSGRDGRPVDALVLETYRGVTLESMRAIAAAALDRFAISRCRIVHRAGRILPGEPIVFVAAASPHRRAAFEAADYLMDRLKTEAVFWKREEGPDGSRWIEPAETDYDDRSRWDAATNARN